ncbi:hypothetical protein JCM8097_009428 [Rhodosporidiobolus ruineniae]
MYGQPSSNQYAPPASQPPYYAQQHQQHPSAYGAPPPGLPPSHGGPPAPHYGSYPGAPGGYGGPPPPGPPPGQGGYGPPPGPGAYGSREGSSGGYGGLQGGASYDPQLRQWFDACDTDRSGAITEAELKQALVNGDWTPFSDDTVKMLMNIFDVDRSGTIGFNEFAGLWQYIKEWQGVFRQFDRDRSGAMDGHELSVALSQFGYNLSPQIIDLLQKKYSPLRGDPSAGPPGITFDRFVRCCVAVKQLSEGFKQHDQDRDGWINVSYEQFMSLVLAVP